MKELVIVAERKAEDYCLCMAASDGQGVKYDMNVIDDVVLN